MSHLKTTFLLVVCIICAKQLLLNNTDNTDAAIIYYISARAEILLRRWQKFLVIKLNDVTVAFLRIFA